MRQRLRRLLILMFVFSLPIVASAAGPRGARHGHRSWLPEDLQSASNAIGTISLIVFIAAFAGIVAAFIYSGRNSRLVNVVLVLKQGMWYNDQLDSMIAKADFDSAGGRTAFTRSLARLITPQDILARAVKVIEPAPGRPPAVEAKELWANQQSELGIGSILKNVPKPNSFELTYDKSSEVTKIETDPDAICFIGLVMVAGKSNADKVRNALIEKRTLREPASEFLPVADSGVIHVYYTPREPGSSKPLARESAEEMLNHISRGPTPAPEKDATPA